MKFLKGLAITLAGFLLFVSLSAWSTVFMLKQTLANPQFVAGEINKLDTAQLGKEMVGDQIKAQLPADLNLTGAVDEVFDEMAPWFKQRLEDITYAVFDYLGGKAEHVSVEISLEPVKTAIEAKIKQALAGSLPSGIAGMPPAQQAELIDQYAAQYADQVPDNYTFEFGEDNIPPEYRGIVSYLRWAVTNLNALYWGLIGLMVVLALGLFALYRDIKGFARSLASPLLTVGVLGFAGIWISESLILPQTGMLGLPPELSRWLGQFIADVDAPLKTLYIGLAADGVVLFLVSIFWRRSAARAAGAPAETPPG
ncbi:MAG: hypothetical protein C4555_00835 [Dehalococcoidia bacterium]|nr:MAG: hypothetical protein C4555_00835 [Dehalococcoidia bacterium]